MQRGSGFFDPLRQGPPFGGAQPVVDVHRGDFALRHRDADLVQTGDDVAGRVASGVGRALAFVDGDAAILVQPQAEPGRERGSGLEAKGRIERIRP